MTHSHRLHLCWPPFAYKAWFLATELAGYVAARKVPALIAVLPPVWEEILTGRRVLGSRDALLQAWQAVRRGADQALAEDPVSGLRELLRAWGLAGCLESHAADVDPDAVARRARRRWSAGLPMLGAADGPLLREIFGACARPPASATGAPTPMS